MAAKDKGSAQRKQKNWRGKSGTVAASPSKVWQDVRDTRTSQLTRRRYQWRRATVAVLFLFSIVGAASFLITLLQREVQFPFVTIVQTAYPHAFPPNSWSYEDLDSLRTGADSLDRKTLDIIDISDGHRSNETLLLNSPDDRKRLVIQAQRSGLIIFYVSLHGLVNDQGEACVATPDASPLDSSTWLPVSHLLSQIKSWNIPDKVHKLLILDCNRQDVNWTIGLLENHFAARLRQAIDATPVPNLVVLNSTSPGEAGLATAEMRGSVFGQFLRLGLAGAADLPQEGGNYDRRVSLKELHQYLLQSVDRWAQANRGVRQQPLMIPSNPPDFRLTCSLDPAQLDGLLTRFASGAAAESAVSRGQLDELWDALSSLRNNQADSFAPLEMGKLRRQLVWLEQASRAGAAYRLDAIAAESELRRLAARLNQRLTRPVSVALAQPKAAEDAEYNDAWVPGLASRLHSLPLLAHLGRVEPAVVDGVMEKLQKLKADASLEKLDAMLVDSPNKPLTNSLEIVHFLRLLHRSQHLRGISDTGAGTLSSTLELHDLAASVAVPSDPRTQPWIRVATDSADTARRRADDVLLAGSPDPGQFETAQTRYREVLAIDYLVRDALVLTDVIMAELPDLVRWLETSGRIHSGEAPVSAEMVSELLNLITATQQLVKSLDEPSVSEAAATASTLSVLPQFYSLRAQYQSLRRHYDDACEQFATSIEFGPNLVRQAAAMLDLPLLSTRPAETGLTPLEQRQKIQSWYSQACRDLHRRSIQRTTTPSTGGDQTEKREPASGGEAAVAENGKPASHLPAAYPLLAILESATPASLAEKKTAGSIGTAESPEAAGVYARQILQKIPREIEAARERHLTSPDQLRLEWCRAARVARHWAPFVTSTWQSDPVAELRKTDIQQILLWQTQRYLDDFWGPSVPGEVPFFESAAKDSIDAARLICIPNPATEKQFSELKSLLASRQRAAHAGLKVRADSLLLVELVDNPKARVAVMSTIPGAGQGMPTGTGMLRITDGKGGLLGPVVDFPIETSAAAGDSIPMELQLALGSTHHDLSDTVGAATAFFRGHEFHDDLVIKTAAGTTIETRSNPIQSARIRLNSNKRQRASVVFVLDCSASMQKEMSFEATGSTVPRLDVAKAALVRMLNALATRGDARVGVLLYGHRVGWNTKVPNQLMIQPTGSEEFPEGLKPYEDVETILPLGRFDNFAAAKVVQRLDKVKPWGETPLYLSLIQALLEFKEDDPDSQRSVVVITDGMNYQFNPPQNMAKSVQDVLVADGSRRIPLHIVGFGIQADEEQGAQREFSRLASETGGQYVSVSEASALAETLEGLLQRRPYSITSANGNTTKASVGTAIDLTWEGDTPQEYVVAIDALAEQVELTGGEAIELLISQDGQSIVSVPYDAGAPVFASLIGGATTESAGVRLGVHLPRREGNDVTFDLSLQHAQQLFVRRPREVWAEITPILADKRPAANLKYVFYDSDFVPRTPVPVLRAVAHGWPKDAVRARIEFWCKWMMTEPTLVIPFSSLPDPRQPATPGISLDGIPGLKYQVRKGIGTPLRVDFIETYSPDVAGGTMLKVDIVGQVTPTRTLRQFDEANRFATHSFLFDNVSENMLDASDSIRVISRRRMFDTAAHLEVPVLIEVPAQSETLPATP